MNCVITARNISFGKSVLLLLILLASVTIVVVSNAKINNPSDTAIFFYDAANQRQLIGAEKKSFSQTLFIFFFDFNN